MKVGDLVKLVYDQESVGTDRYWKRWGLKAGDLGIILKSTAGEMKHSAETLVYVAFPSVQRWMSSENLMNMSKA